MTTLLTTTDIAELANVTVQSVTNWKKRHQDFPKPVEIYRRAPLYRQHEVEEWLRTR